jgi:hypothetical protein
MRSLIVQSVMVVVVGCMATIADASAAPDRFHSKILGDHSKLNKLISRPARAGEKFGVLKFQSNGVFGIGNLKLVFNARKLPAADAVFVNGSRTFKDSIVPTLMKGYALLNRSSGEERRVSAALSVVRNRVRVQFLTSWSSKQSKAARIYALTWKLTESSSAVASISTQENGSLLNKLCDSHGSNGSHAVASLSTSSSDSLPRATTLAKVVTISTDADPELYAIYGEGANAEIAATLNAAEAIFERQLGIRFAMVRQHVYIGASPYVSNDSSALLGSFAKNPANIANLSFSPLTFNQDVDVKILFTGKELLGNVIGLSYVGAVCWSPQNAYGLVQNINRELNITTLAHELGHLLGAAHDTSDANGIMYPNLGIKRDFSPVSVAQINRTLANNGKCVSEELVTANLANATLTLKQKASRDKRSLVLSGTLLSNLSQPLPNEIVKLILNKKIVFAMTDAAGAFSYRIKLANLKTKTLKVFAQTMNNETTIPAAIKVPVRA